MKKRVHKRSRAIRFILTVFTGVLLIMGISIFMEGMYLIGIPDIDNVQKVTILYSEVTNEIKEFSDEEQIELAVKLTGFLKYSLTEKADDKTPPMITITYYLEDGQSLSVSANRDTVWWKGKAHAVKDKGTFIKLTEGVFFLEEIQAE
ncbi:MAG: hypothetical protein LUH07_15395 [Lachnospiraceae bacterium]|nr:hypothetical protein [Lachnospiraceae bacterium]